MKTRTSFPCCCATKAPIPPRAKGVDRGSAAGSAGPPACRQTWAGALALGRRHQFDEPHGTHVATLALSLFDQLQTLHGLKDAERRILMAAGVTHDVGMQISYKKHHKHSFGLISEAELPDLTPRQMLLTAHVARYHRKAEPTQEHEAFAALDGAERRIVEVLAALLRVADALDREHRQNVTGIRVMVLEGVVRLALEGEGDLMTERWAVDRKAGLFEKVFGRKLILTERGDE